MTKIIEEDDFENDFESDFEGPSMEEFEDDDSDDSSSGGLDFEDDEDNLDIIIEIDEDELDLIEEVKPTTENDDIVLSKHKIEGKHSLKYDSIFKGKKEDPVDEDDTADLFSGYYKETIEVDRGSNYHFESTSIVSL